MTKKLFTLPKLIILILILLVAYMGLWFGLRSIVVSGISDSIAQLETDGYAVEHGGLSITGFPFTIDASSQNVAVKTTPSAVADPFQNWSIKTADLDFYSPTLSPLSWTLRHQGEMRVDMRIANGERYMLDVSPANIFADFTYSFSGKLKKFHADISRTQLKPLVGAEPAVLGLAGFRADLDVKADKAHLDILGKDIVVSQKALGVIHSVLGQDISRLSLNAEIENWQLLETEGAESWMQSPAKIISEDWQLKWGSADIIGSLDLGFKNTYPEGVIRFRVKNLNALMDKLSTANLLEPLIADQINGFMTGVDSDEDGRKSIEITIRDGVVKYGFFTIYRF